jgi:hypothetical protein
MSLTPLKGSASSSRPSAMLSGIRRHWAEAVAWGALLAFTVLGIGTPLLGQGTFLGTEGFLSFSPWSSTIEEPADDLLLTGDTIDSVSPQTMLLTEQAAAGDFAEWNPYVAGGAELGGIPNSGAYSPLSVPWWVLPAEVAAGFVKLLEIAVIAVGMSLLLRRLGIVRVAWPLASLAFASSGFMIAWTNWPQTRVAAFIPLLFWALDRAASRARVADVVPVALAVAAMLLGGFPAIVGYALYAGGAYVIVRAATSRRRIPAVFGSIGVAFAGVVAGAAVAAWQLVPFAVNAVTVIDFGVRGQTPDDHLPLSALASALVPDVNGGPDPVGVWTLGHPVEVFSYLGAIVVALAIAALVIVPRARSRRSGAAYFAVGLLICLVITYVGGLFLAPFLELPIFSTNNIGRLRVLVGFFTAVLAAYGMQAILDPAPARALLRASRHSARAALRLLSGVALAGVLLAGAVVLVVTAFERVPLDHRRPILREELAFTVLGVGLAALLVLLWFFVRRRVLRGLVAATLPILIAIPAIGVTAVWWPTSSEETFYADTATHDFLARTMGGERYASIGMAMMPGSNSAYRLRSVGGHSFHTKEWKELLEAVDPDSFGTETFSTLTPGGLERSVDSPILDRLGVRYLVSPPRVVVGDLEAAPAAPSSVAATDSVPVRSNTLDGPLRGLTLDLRSYATSADGVTVDVEIVDVAGNVLTSTSTWYEAVSGPWTIAVAGEELDTAWSARVTFEGLDQPLLVGGVDEQTIAIGVLRPREDGLRTVHTGDATVYERKHAMPRVRWASEPAVIPIDEQVAAMESGSVADDAVVFAASEELDLPDPGSTADITVSETAIDTTSYRVDADGAGWLLIEDSFGRPGWSATVDGRDAAILTADHAAGAVFVPAGEHSVEVRYRTPGLPHGIWVSVAAIFVLVGISTAALLRRRSRDSVSGRGAARRTQV